MGGGEPFSQRAGGRNSSLLGGEHGFVTASANAGRRGAGGGGEGRHDRLASSFQPWPETVSLMFATAPPRLARLLHGQQQELLLLAMQGVRLSHSLIFV